MFIASLAAGSPVPPQAGSPKTQQVHDVRHVLDWLPPDTETIFVANGPIWMSDFRTGKENGPNYRLSAEDLEKAFESETLGFFDFKNDFAVSHLARKKVLLAVEGSRKFRNPAGLGMMPFEGCEIAVFQDDLTDARAALLKDAAAKGFKVDGIGGEKVVVLQDRLESDIWTTYVAIVGKSVAVVATDRGYLQEVVARIHGAAGPPALPDSLPEWKFVDRTTKFWGLRHFDKREPNDDPTSPLAGPRAANLADEKAIGITFQCDPGKALSANTTYLSADTEGIRRIEERRFPAQSAPTANAGLHIRYEQIEPGAIRGTYDLAYSEPLNWFLFVLGGSLGHAVFL